MNKDKIFYPTESGVSAERIAELICDVLWADEINPANNNITYDDVISNVWFCDEFLQSIADRWDDMWVDEDTLDEDVEEEIINKFGIKNN